MHCRILMNPYTQAPVVLQLFVIEPFDDTVAVIDLIVVGTAPDQVCGPAAGPIRRVSSDALDQPVDLVAAQRGHGGGYRERIGGPIVILLEKNLLVP